MTHLRRSAREPRAGDARSCLLKGGVYPMNRPMAAAGRLLALVAALACAPGLATAQTPSMFSNLAKPAIGMNALFSGQAAHHLNQPYGLSLGEGEGSLMSAVDPYRTSAGHV